MSFKFTPSPHLIINHEVETKNGIGPINLDKEKEKIFVTNGRIHLVKKSVSTLGRLLI